MRLTRQSLNLKRASPPWKILFFGTDDFSLYTLQALHENTSHPNVAKRVVELVNITHPRTRKPTPVTKYAALCDLHGHQWPIKNFGGKIPYDVGVLASFGHLIPKSVVESFPYGIINVHPSLLPRWRGAAPLHHTILNGDARTGVSIMSIQPKHFDVGPILAQREVDVPPQCTTRRLREVLGQEGAAMTLDVLSKLPELVDRWQPQDQYGALYAHKLTTTHSFINWESQTVEDLDRHYRALNETEELRSEWQDLTVRLLDMVDPKHKAPDMLDPTSPPGLPVYNKQDGILWVKCKDGWAGFANIVIKKKMSSKAFYNGYLSKKHLKGIAFSSKDNGLFGDKYKLWTQSRKPS